jgi:PAS domain S-box-containing protein
MGNLFLEASSLAGCVSFVFSEGGLPREQKRTDREQAAKLLDAHRRLLAEVPGIEVMEQLFQRLTGVLFCVKDREGRYLAVNDAFLRRVRVSDREALVGRTAREVFPALLAAGYEQQDARVFSQEREMRERLEMITNPDGSMGWYLSEKVPVRDGEGRVVALAGISRDLHMPADGDPRLAQLAKVINRMRREYAEPLRIGRLAEEAGLSLSKFERMMKSVLHVSPRQFLTRLRVEAAAERLQEGERSIAEIALDCGFCDQATFCRQFKAVTGLTAGRYRKLAAAAT